jgi:hypothetical protein
MSLSFRLRVGSEGHPPDFKKAVKASPLWFALPQAHGPDAQAITFPVFQTSGFVLALNEIALPVAFIAVFASNLLVLHDDIRKVFQDTARLVVESIGGVAINVQGRPWFKLN